MDKFNRGRTFLPLGDIYGNWMKIRPCNKTKKKKKKRKRKKERGEGTFVTIWSSHPRKRNRYVESQRRRRPSLAPPVPTSSGTKKHVRKLPRKLGNVELEYVWKIREWRSYRHRSAVRPLIIRMWPVPPCDLHTAIRLHGLALGVYLEHLDASLR